MSSNVCYLYHICREKDKGDLTKGYVGISSSPERRWGEHASYGNAHLKNAFSKYSDVVKYVVTKGTTLSCLWLEFLWRPVKGLGWNISQGGGLPPSSLGRKHSKETKGKIGAKSKGRVFSVQSLKKMSDSHIGKESNMKGKTHSAASRLKISKAQTGVSRGAMREETCPYCQVTGWVSLMKRYHFGFCKENPNAKEREKRKYTHSKEVTCPHCSKVGSARAMTRWHFNNCKHKECSE
ncbi:homing endonuclease [Vibrio phage K449]